MKKKTSMKNKKNIGIPEINTNKQKITKKKSSKNPKTTKIIIMPKKRIIIT